LTAFNHFESMAFMQKRLKNVSEAVAVLGGNRSVAALAGVRETAVCNWKRTGFPPSVWLVISGELHALGYEVDPSIFAFKPKAAPRKA
jgi:hypothetical protein